MSKLRQLARLSTAFALLAAVVFLVVSASAEARTGTWSRPLDRGLVEAAHIDGTKAKRRVKDVVRPADVARASSHQPSRVEVRTDVHGHDITIGTSIAGLDLAPYAGLLAGIYHRAEIEQLRTIVVPLSDVPAECGGPPGTVACYGPDDPDRSFSGVMVIGSDDTDLAHSVVHEYGHHMDNQLVNLGHLGLCDFSRDGSRRWFFARDADDDVFRRSGCNDSVSYERLLGELYAEDFAFFNGIRKWGLSAFRPPRRHVIDALYDDIFEPFYPRTRRFRGRLADGYYRPRRFDPPYPTFFRARLVGPRTSDLDLVLRRPGGRVVKRSVRRGSREKIAVTLPEGPWELRVVSYRGGGRYRLRVDLD